MVITNYQQTCLIKYHIALLDTICGHVFTAIVETRHILRLRRNVTKLAFYNHLIYMLIFAVIG